MNKGLKILTLSALCLTMLAGCSDNASIDYQLNQLETTITRSDISQNSNDFFLNEFAGTTNNIDFYNNAVTTSNTEAIIKSNIDTYKKTNKSNGPVLTASNLRINGGRMNNNSTMSNYSTSNAQYSRNGYNSKYSDFRDESLKYNRINNLEGMYDIAYDINMAKSKYRQIKDQVLIQINDLREYLDLNQDVEIDNSVITEYVTLIQTNVEKLRMLNDSYTNYRSFDSELTSEFLNARYYNILACIESKIDTMEDISEGLYMIAIQLDSTLFDSYNYLLENQNLDNSKSQENNLFNQNNLNNNINENMTANNNINSKGITQSENNNAITNSENTTRNNSIARRNNIRKNNVNNIRNDMSENLSDTNLENNTTNTTNKNIIDTDTSNTTNDNVDTTTRNRTRNTDSMTTKNMVKNNIDTYGVENNALKQNIDTYSNNIDSINNNQNINQKRIINKSAIKNIDNNTNIDNTNSMQNVNTTLDMAKNNTVLNTVTVNTIDDSTDLKSENIKKDEKNTEELNIAKRKRKQEKSIEENPEKSIVNDEESVDDITSNKALTDTNANIDIKRKKIKKDDNQIENHMTKDIKDSDMQNIKTLEETDENFAIDENLEKNETIKKPNLNLKEKRLNRNQFRDNNRLDDPTLVRQ